VGSQNEGRTVPPAGLVRRLIFWDFPRASWQYDVVVALILLCIFATPREWFKDQPKTSPVVLLSSGRGGGQMFIANDLLENIPEAGRAQAAAKVIRQRTGKNWRVDRVEPIRDEAEQEVKGYIAYTSQPN
jgi:hypothetical protein